MTTPTRPTSPSRPRPLADLSPRLLWAVAAGLALLAAVQLLLAWDEVRLKGMDLQQDYIAAQRLLAGESLFTEFSAAEVSALGVREELGTGMRRNVHPPLAVLLVAPLTLLPFSAAALIWTLGGAALLLATAWRIIDELGLPLRGPWRAIALLLLLSWYPVWLHMHLGQWTIPLLALLVGAWICLRRGRDGLAGVLIGLAALIKLYPLLLFGYALWRGRWRMAAAGAATVALLVLAQAALAPRHYVEFVAEVVAATDETWRVSPRNASLSTISARLFAGSEEVRPLIDLPAAEQPARAAIYALAAALFAAALWRARPRRDLTGEIAALICAMALFSPLSWEHAIILMLLPLGYVWARARELGPGRLRLPVALAGLALALSFYAAEPTLLAVQAAYAPGPMPAWMGLHAPGLVVLVCAAAATLLALQPERAPGAAAGERA